MSETGRAVEYGGLFEAVQHAADGIVITDTSGKIQYVNPAFTTLTGYTGEEAVGQNPRFLRSERHSAAFYGELWSTLLCGRVWQGYVTNRRKDGALFDEWMQIAPVKDANGVTTGYIAIKHDVTAQRAHEQTQRLLAAIVESSNDAMIAGTRAGLIVAWNRGAEGIFGYSASEAIGKPISMLMAPEHLVDLEYFQGQILQGITVPRYQSVCLRKDGSRFHVSVAGSPVKSATGEVVSTSAVLRDVTQRYEAERELIRARQGADAANQAKSEFLANMSHEIRTPMNGVIGMTGLLLDTELTAEQRRYAEVARASGEALLQLINGILDFSKIEAKKLELEMIDFDLRPLLNNLVSIFSATAQAKGIEFLCVADPAVPTQLRGDPGRLRQILTNLAGNAIKFTDKGEVVVRVVLEEEGESDCLLRFSVRDTGIGIPEDKIGVLFNKFSQVEVSTTRKYGGTGLGLAISKQLAELMGGGVGVASQEGKGSEFWFTVRMGRSWGRSGEAEAPLQKSKMAIPLHARILIAEDNSTNREVALGMLRKLGLHANAVANGAEVINALESGPYDLVLMDMRMPVMDGLEAARQIRNPQSAVLDHDIPIIALTANAMQSDRESCLAAGMNDFITKPIVKAELGNALRNWLRTDDIANPKPSEKVVTSRTVEEAELIFDRDGVLDRLEGDKELAQIVFAAFLEDTPRQIQTLKDFVKRGDTAGSARQAHTIRGASASVGGEGLRKVATEMEKAADAGDLNRVNISMPELEEQFLLLRDAIRIE